MLHHVAECGCEDAGLSDDPAVHKLLDLVRQRHVPGPDGLGYEEAFLAGSGDELFSLGRIGGEGLLHQHRLSVLKRQHRMLEMVGVRSGDIHQVHLRILYQLLIASVCGNYIMFRCKCFSLFLCARGDCIYFHVFKRCDRTTHLMCNPPCSYYADSEHDVHFLNNS